MTKIISVVILNVAILYQFAMAEEMGCKKCHQNVYDEISTVAFRHYDNILDECKGCHLSAKGSGEKVDKWVKVSLSNYGREHMAVLKNMSMDSAYQVKVTLMDKRGKKKESDTISFVPASISEFLVDDETPPVISGIRLNHVDTSSVEIEFETDKFSDSMAEYGTTKDYGKSSYSGTYSKRHIIRLSRLDHKKVYHFMITVSDPFGNRTISEDYTFDTGKALNRSQESEKQKEDNTKLDFQSIRILRFKLKEKDLKEESLKDAVKKATVKEIVAVYFTGTAEVSSIVEYMKKEDENTADEDKHGKGLKSQRETGIDTCVEKCHKQGGSHAVGVTLRRNMSVPDEIPLAKGKMITCATCHLPHASKIKYLARMDFSKLCVLCHTDR
jgi:predicted CXXCH cytochrome family protein